MNILIIGAGAYGLALANTLCEKNKVTVYSVNEEEIINLNKKYTNEKLFPSIKLSKKIKFTSDIMEKDNIELLIIAIPTNYIKKTIQNLKISKKTKILIASKGIEKETNQFVYDIVKSIYKKNSIYLLSGPSFAIDTIKKEKILLTLAGIKTKRIRAIFPNEYIKTELTKDIIGTQICGTLKNIFAIASGILEGMKASESTKAAFMTKIINETRNIIIKCGGDKETILKSCGIGDIILTCTSKNSRNYFLGNLIGSNKSKSEINEYKTNTTIEGLEALESMKNILSEQKIKCEIINLIYDIVINNYSPILLLDYIIK